MARVTPFTATERFVRRILSLPDKRGYRRPEKLQFAGSGALFLASWRRRFPRILKA
jgi:hypothetical protein